jgi:hypothetical protein
MKVVTQEEILNIAQSFHTNKSEWHFHLLTPDCMLNTSKQFALVVEDKDAHEVYVYATKDKPMATSETLLRLLHGNQIMDKNKEEKGNMSATVTTMMIRAKELNDHGFFWHHHVLFPYCTYNRHQDKWTIIFEDPEKKEIIESISDKEPKADMNTIEPAFYHQHVQK